MIRILDWYIARSLFSTIMGTLMVLVGLSGLIKFVEQLRKIGDGEYDISVALIYVLLSVPRDFEQFFPMATLLGGLVGMGMLANNSELVVMQAAGLSRFNIIQSAMKSAFILILFVLAVGEWVTPYAEAKAKEIRSQAISGGRLLATSQLTWAKDGEDFVSIGQVIQRDLLQNVTIYKFDEKMVLASLTQGKQARFQDNTWYLYDVTTTQFTQESITNATSSNMRWDTSLTPEKLGIFAIKPEALSIQGLVEYIDYLDKNLQDSSRYQLAFWRKAFQPIAVCIMLLMALSFIFGPLRSVTMGARIIMGVLVGFGFFITNEVFGPLSMVYQLPPAIGAILPSIVFASIATWMLRR